MTAAEAMKMLLDAPRDAAKPAALNKSLSQAHAHEIIWRWISGLPGDHELSSLEEKRVLQIHQNRKRPRRG
jgi:hypothetical protein